MAVRAVEGRVVVEAGAEQQRGERRGGHAIAEVADEHEPEDEQARQSPTSVPAYAGGMLIVEGEAVG